jgi:hypothetical protein
MCIVGNYIIDLHKHQKQVEKETLESFSGMLRRKRNLKKIITDNVCILCLFSNPSKSKINI